MNTSTEPKESQPREKISAWLLWYGALGGVVAWTVQLFIGWSVYEVACIGNGPGFSAKLTNWVAIGVPWVATVLALVAILRVRSKLRRLEPDELTTDRTELIITVGLILDVFSLMIITGSGIGLFVLAPCGVGNV